MEYEPLVATYILTDFNKLIKGDTHHNKEVPNLSAATSYIEMNFDKRN